LVKTRNLVEEAYLGSLKVIHLFDIDKINYIELVSVDSTQIAPQQTRN